MALRRPLFLEKAHYRRSRAIDAARILPIAGFVLLLLPILWTGNERIGITHAALFVLGLWALLIVLAFWLGRLLRDPHAPAPAVPQSPPADPIRDEPTEPRP